MGVSSTGVRVKVSQDFILPPPIDFRPYVFKEVRTSGFTFDFSFEREFLVNARNQCSEANGDNACIPSNTPITDPWEQRIAQFIGMGYDREAVSMALILHLTSPDQKVKEYLERFGQMKTMGFDSGLASAALMHHGEDIQAAAETLLANQE